MIRASVLTGRFRRGRREAPGLAGRDASRLFSAPVSAPGAGEQAPPGSLTPQARRQLDEALARGMRTGERPYSGITADQQAAYQIALLVQSSAPRPAYYPAKGAAPATAPHPVVSDSTLDMPEVLVLRRIRDGLQGLDWAALDAARAQEGATHAAMRRARGQAPFGDYMDRTFRHLALRHPHRGGLNEARVVTLAYPVPGQVADDGDYAEVMRRLNQITGTQGWAPRRALTAGGAS